MAMLMILTSAFGLVSCMGTTTPTPTPGPTTQTCTNHKDENHDGKCDNIQLNCTATVKVEHVDENHDGVCDVKKCGKKNLKVTHNDKDNNFVCDDCEAILEHTCVNGDADTLCDICGKDMSVPAHDCVDEEGDGLCDICFEEMPVPKCTQCTDYNGDNICEVCNSEVNCICVDADGDTECDYCTAYVKPAEVVIDYDWEQTSLIMQLTENTQNGELLSVSKKYLAGEDTDASDDIADSVRLRNVTGQNATKVKVTYKYYPDTSEYGWGSSIERIQETNLKGGAEAPDIYCNFVYDMVGASLKECFANLLTTSKRGTNYFEFNDESYNPEKSDRGYMYEYMQSLTLAPATKMYVLASDYFIDMVRAFFCIPVSIKIMEDSGASIVAQNPQGMAVHANGDRNGDGEFTIDDFYEQVKAGEWTYDLLAKFSAAVYKPGAASDGACVIGDDVVGFAMATGGLSASGLLYTTSVEIIKKESDGKGGFNYYYPPENEDFYAFCDATTKLFGESTGICIVDKGYTQYGDSSLKAIRARFSQNKVLFGDIMLIGALEFNEYQEMKETGGGFGVVPVPLYRSGSDDKYLTQIHNVGSCGAIAAVTTKFKQCTAFLNYQSTHSEDILNNYYKYKLQYDVADGSTGTVEMLQYIRDNVRSSFDKAMEDAIGVFNVEASNKKWHNVLQGYDFQVDIRAEYKSEYNAKAQYLKDLAAAFVNYQD